LPTQIQLEERHQVLSKLFFGDSNTTSGNVKKLIFYIIKRYLSLDEILKLIVACGKNMNLKKLFIENDILDFPNLSFSLIYVKQPILCFKNSKIFIPLVNTIKDFTVPLYQFYSTNFMVPPNSFLEIQNVDVTQGGQGLFNILQNLLPLSHRFNTSNQQYLFITYDKATSSFPQELHFNVLLTLENNDCKILLRSDNCNFPGMQKKIMSLQRWASTNFLIIFLTLRTKNIRVLVVLFVCIIVQKLRSQSYVNLSFLK
jgi:hypothetical protein